MNHRERVITALEHRTTDRPPLIGHFEREIWDQLVDYYSTDEERIMRHFGLDFRNVEVSDHATTYTESPYFDYKVMMSKRLPDGSYEDLYGIRKKWSTTLSGHSSHWIIVHHPLENIGSMNEYEFPELPDPTEAEISHAAEKFRYWHNEGYALGCGFHPICIFEWAWHLRGFRKLVTDMYINEKFVNDLLDKLVERTLKRMPLLAQLYELSGQAINVIATGDDVGTQVGMMIRPEQWRKFIKPRMEKLIRAAKNAANNAYCDYHSDGRIEPIVPDLIEIGVDILNPVQPDCMDPAEIKRLYGDKLTLEGTVSVQETLPFGTVEEVKAVVKKRIETCGYDGGLILGPSHTVEPPTPIENVIAFYETAQKYKPSWAS